MLSSITEIKMGSCNISRNPFVLLIDYFFVRLENQPLREDVVGDDDHHVIQSLDDELLQWRSQAQDADANPHKSHVDQKGQGSVEEELTDLNHEGLNRCVVGAKDPHFIGEVSN